MKIVHGIFFPLFLKCFEKFTLIEIVIIPHMIVNFVIFFFKIFCETQIAWMGWPFQKRIIFLCKKLGFGSLLAYFDPLSCWKHSWGHIFLQYDINWSWKLSFFIASIILSQIWSMDWHLFPENASASVMHLPLCFIVGITYLEKYLLLLVIGCSICHYSKKIKLWLKRKKYFLLFSLDQLLFSLDQCFLKNIISPTFCCCFYFSFNTEKLFLTLIFPKNYVSVLWRSTYLF